MLSKSRRMLAFVFFCASFASLATASAASSGASSPQTLHSIEVNALWPFFPGGISEFRYVAPVANIGSDLQGDLVLGLYSDFASRFVRDDKYGKVSVYSAKLGYRQHFAGNWHAEFVTNVGWREEIDRPGAADKKIAGIAVRLWSMVGYQQDFSKIFYANARAGLGQHLYRSDDYADTEKKTVAGFDLNVGVRF